MVATRTANKAEAPSPAPVVPATWTPLNIITFVGAAVLFLFSTLDQTGVLHPVNVTAAVNTYEGIGGQVASIVAAVVASVSHDSVRKTAIKAAASV